MADNIQTDKLFCIQNTLSVASAVFLNLTFPTLLYPFYCALVGSMQRYRSETHPAGGMQPHLQSQGHVNLHSIANYVLLINSTFSLLFSSVSGYYKRVGSTQTIFSYKLFKFTQLMPSSLFYPYFNPLLKPLFDPISIFYYRSVPRKP